VGFLRNPVPDPLAGPVAQDLRHSEFGVVVQDRQRHAAEEGEGRDVAVARHASVVSAGYALMKNASECGSAIAK
jgi:hypothetical protein